MKEERAITLLVNAICYIHGQTGFDIEHIAKVAVGMTQEEWDNIKDEVKESE